MTSGFGVEAELLSAPESVDILSLEEAELNEPLGVAISLSLMELPASSVLRSSDGVRLDDT